MLPTVGSALYRHKYEPASQLGLSTSPSRREAISGRVYTHTDRNDNYSSKKRPAVTIASSQPQAFRKKKVGFDAEQCGFLRINDIIMTISGNVNKTYGQVSLSSDKTTFIKELAFAKIQSQENRVNWHELKKLSSSKERKNGYVSEALASYLKASDRTETKNQPIDRQLLDLDIIVKDDVSSISFFSDGSSSNAPINQPPPRTGPAGLWTELKKKGFKEVKHSKSLFEMLVPGDSKHDYHDLSTRRKSAVDPDSMFDKVASESIVSALGHGNISEVSEAEQKYESGKKNKKYVTIIGEDGKVHSPGERRMSDVDDENAEALKYVPSILITPASRDKTPSSAASSLVSLTQETARTASSVRLPSSSQSSIVSTGQDNETGQVSDVFPHVKTRSRLFNTRVDPTAIASATNIYQAARDVTDSPTSDNNSSNSTSNRWISRRHIHQVEIQRLHPVRLNSFSSAARHTGGFNVSSNKREADTGVLSCSRNLSSNKVETDSTLIQWKLLQIAVDIETLRRENCRLKRKMLQWTRASDQKVSEPSSVCCEYFWRLSTILSCLTMIIIGIILGKFII